MIRISLPEDSLLQGTFLQQALLRRPATFNAALEDIYRFSDPVEFADVVSDRLCDELLAVNMVPTFFTLGQFQAHLWIFCFNYFWAQKGSTVE